MGGYRGSNWHQKYCQECKRPFITDDYNDKHCEEHSG